MTDFVEISKPARTLRLSNDVPFKNDVEGEALAALKRLCKSDPGHKGFNPKFLMLQNSAKLSDFAEQLKVDLAVVYDLAKWAHHRIADHGIGTRLREESQKFLDQLRALKICDVELLKEGKIWNPLIVKMLVYVGRNHASHLDGCDVACKFVESALPAKPSESAWGECVKIIRFACGQSFSEDERKFLEAVGRYSTHLEIRSLLSQKALPSPDLETQQLPYVLLGGRGDLLPYMMSLNPRTPYYCVQDDPYHYGSIEEAAEILALNNLRFINKRCGDLNIKPDSIGTVRIFEPGFQDMTDSEIHCLCGAIVPGGSFILNTYATHSDRMKYMSQRRDLCQQLVREGWSVTCDIPMGLTHIDLATIRLRKVKTLHADVDVGLAVLEEVFNPDGRYLYGTQNRGNNNPRLILTANALKGDSLRLK